MAKLIKTHCQDHEDILEGAEGTVTFSSKWLLRQLVGYLHTHMDYKCVHKKFGTILFKKKGDLLISLSWALDRSETPKYTEQCFDSVSKINGEDVVLSQAGNSK